MLIDNDDSVGSQNNVVRMANKDGQRLVAGQALRVRERRLLWQWLFAHVCRIDGERNRGVAQKLGAARRRGGKNQHGSDCIDSAMCILEACWHV